MAKDSGKKSKNDDNINDEEKIISRNRKNAELLIEQIANQHHASHQASIAKDQASSSISDSKRSYLKFCKESIEYQRSSLNAQLIIVSILENMTQEEEILTLFELLDRNQDGHVDTKELADGFKYMEEENKTCTDIEGDGGEKGGANQHNQKTAVEAIQAFDADGDGELDREEFRDFFTMLLSCNDNGTNIDDENEPDHTSLVTKALLNILSHLVVDGSGNGDVPSKILLEAGVSTRENRDSAREHERTMTHLFQVLDTDNDGKVEMAQLSSRLRKLDPFKNQNQSLQDLENVNNQNKLFRARRMSSALEALLFVQDGDSRFLDYNQFVDFVLRVVSLCHCSLASAVDVLLHPISDNSNSYIPSGLTNEEQDAIEAAALDFKRAVEEAAGLLDVIESGRINRLFDLWDLDGDEKISLSELILGMRKCSPEQKDLKNLIEASIMSIVEFDTNDDQHLDRNEFAVFINKVAKGGDLDVHELIDFLVVISTIFISGENL